MTARDDIKYFLMTSFGNDSSALIQWAHDAGLKNVVVCYSETGWAADYWQERVKIGADWVRGMGFEFHQTESIGMAGLLRMKKAWPRGGGGKFQFCTEHLKKQPALEYMNNVDPQKEAIVMTGIMRIEGGKRSTAPEHVTDSEAHGGRDLWSPLVRHTLADRNELIAKTPLPLLPYRSKECWPCVNAGAGELKNLEPSRIDLIEALELEAGVNSKGNPRVMFSPKRHGGAVGIRAVVDSAKKGVDDAFPVQVCSSGWCE